MTYPFERKENHVLWNFISLPLETTTGDFREVPIGPVTLLTRDSNQFILRVWAKIFRVEKIRTAQLYFISSLVFGFTLICYRVGHNLNCGLPFLVFAFFGNWNSREGFILFR